MSLFVFHDETEWFDLLLSGHLIVSEVIILWVWQIGNLMITSAAHLSFLSHNSAKHNRLSSLGCHPQLVPALRKIKYQGECYQVRLTNKSSTDWRVAENCLYERPRPSHPLLSKACSHLSISGVSQGLMQPGVLQIFWLLPKQPLKSSQQEKEGCALTRWANQAGFGSSQEQTSKVTP